MNFCSRFFGFPCCPGVGKAGGSLCIGWKDQEDKINPKVVSHLVGLTFGIYPKGCEQKKRGFYFFLKPFNECISSYWQMSDNFKRLDQCTRLMTHAFNTHAFNLTFQLYLKILISMDWPTSSSCSVRRPSIQ